MNANASTGAANAVARDKYHVYRPMLDLIGFAEGIRRLDRREASNLFAITEVVFGLAARQAAGRISREEQRIRLTERFAALRDQAEDSDPYNFIKLRNAYFRMLIEISGNDELWRLLPKLQVHLFRNRTDIPREERVKCYGDVTNAVLNSDEEAAEAAARRYVQMAAARILPHFPDDST